MNRIIKNMKSELKNWYNDTNKYANTAEAVNIIDFEEMKTLTVNIVMMLKKKVTV